MTFLYSRSGRCLTFAIFSSALIVAAQASPAGDREKIAKLSLDVQRLEDLRAVKKLQVSYSQYAQFGLWSQMAALFANSGEAIYGADDLKGRAAIGKYYLVNWGNSREGLAAGGVRAQLDDTPIVNLSADGKTAKGRWAELAMIGQYGASPGMNGWAIGLMENEYVKEDGVWKISRLHYYPYVAGPYATGWKNVGPDLPIIPYHFTPQTAAVPVPAIPSDLTIPAINGIPTQALAAVDRRIAALNDEDAVRNLQNQYGYYVDRKMWDDVGDLFTTDAVLEEADVGIYSGASSIRRSLERFGPQGLKRGQLNEHTMFDTNVTISPDGREARLRGIEFRELGDFDNGTASLGLATFNNRFIKGADGIWRICEMRIFPQATTDYYQGWNKSRLATPPVTGAYAPDKPVPAGDRVMAGAIPVFFQRHPVTGKPVALPKGAKIVADTRLVPIVASKAAAKPPADLDTAIADSQRRLSRSLGYDAVDNITHAFGQYINDNDFDEEGQLYADDGWRGKHNVGFCVGPDHVAQCEATWSGTREVHFALPNPRVTLNSRWMLQPVIIVSEDGKTAKERARGDNFNMSGTRAGNFLAGMYPDNQAKVVNGVWKFDVVGVEEYYWESANYEDGWARYKTPTPRAAAAGGRGGRGADAVIPMPPDVDRLQVMPVRFWGIDDHPDPADVINWPDIKPMWFNYKNPVSGREPPNYCLDIKTCEKDLETNGHSRSHFN